MNPCREQQGESRPRMRERPPRHKAASDTRQSHPFLPSLERRTPRKRWENGVEAEIRPVDPQKYPRAPLSHDRLLTRRHHVEIPPFPLKNKLASGHVTLTSQSREGRRPNTWCLGNHDLFAFSKGRLRGEEVSHLCVGRNCFRFRLLSLGICILLTRR